MLDDDPRLGVGGTHLPSAAARPAATIGSGETQGRASPMRRGLRDRAAAVLPEHAGPGLVAAATALAAALYAWRSGDSAVHPQLVAEDGAVFFTGAKLQGLGSLFDPYAGYLHLLPRLAALAAAAFPSPVAPLLYLVLATGIVAWSAATIAACREPHAWVLAPLALLVANNGDGEVFGTLTNVQWLTGPALALVVATASPPGRLARTNQVAFATLASLTGPFSIFILPVAVWRLFRDRADAFARLLCGVVLLGGAVQLGMTVTEPPATAGVERPLQFAATMMDRWIGQAAHPGRTVRPAHRRDVAILVAAAAVSAATVPRLAAKLYCFAAVSLLATFVRFLGDNSYFEHTGAAERYFYGPRLVILWTLALCLLRLRWSSIAGSIGLVLMLSAVQIWRKPPFPHLPWAQAAETIDRGLPVRIIINPSDPADPWPGAWAVTLPARASRPVRAP